MTEPTNPTDPTNPAEPTTPADTQPDETFGWTAEDGAPEGANSRADAGAAGSTGSSASGAASTATALLDQLREAVDELAERATPTVREFSARAADLAATAADRAI